MSKFLIHSVDAMWLELNQMKLSDRKLLRSKPLGITLIELETKQPNQYAVGSLKFFIINV